MSVFTTRKADARCDARDVARRGAGRGAAFGSAAREPVVIDAEPLESRSAHDEPAYATGSPESRSARPAVGRRVAAVTLAAAIGAAALHGIGDAVATPPPAPQVQLTPAQAALADSMPAHPGIVPVLEAGRVSEHSSTAEPAMHPRTLALAVATLTRAGYRFTGDPSNPERSGRAVALVVDADPGTLASVDPILERYDAHAIALPRPDRFGRPTTAPETSPVTDGSSRHRWTLVGTTPAATERLPLATDITPERLLEQLSATLPAPVRLDSPAWISTGADCVAGDGRLHVAALAGAGDTVCRPAVNSDGWQDYRLIADVTARSGSAVITLRDRSLTDATRHGRIEVRLEPRRVQVVEAGDGTPEAPAVVLGEAPLASSADGVHRVEAGIEGDALTVAVDGMPVRTRPATAAVNPSGGVAFGAEGRAAEATFVILGIAGR